MVKLGCDCYVSADEIAEMSVNSYATSITIRMKSGVGHSVFADHGKGIYATLDRLAAEVNAAQRDRAE
jgi:hypothetical protein